MKQKKIKEILEKNKKDWEELADNFSQTRHNPWLEFDGFQLYVKTGDKILDLGCGNGRLYEWLKNKRVEYIGVDQSKELIKIAEGRAIKQFNKPKFIVSDALNLENKFSENSFDVIFSIAFLHHLPSEELRLKVLKDCFSFLKPNGFIIFTVWNLYQPRLIWKYKILRKNAFIPFKQKEKTIKRYYYVFNKRELIKLFEKTGFKIIDCYYVRKGERDNWLRSYNLVLIAQKN